MNRMPEDLPQPSGEFLFYSGPDGLVKVECRLQDETLWLTQRLMADLFGVGVPAINKHLKNIFESGELREAEVISILETTTHHGAIEGKTQTQKTRFYNLDAIIAVGYRVNSYQATQFRIWATRTLKEFIIKGFVMDDERLKQGGQVFGRDYFEELLERIREIRASERRFYQKITDIYATAVDFRRGSSPESRGRFRNLPQTPGSRITIRLRRGNSPHPRRLIMPDQNDVSTASGLLCDSLVENEQRISSERAKVLNAALSTL